MSRAQKLIAQGHSGRQTKSTEKVSAIPNKEVVVLTCMDTRINPYSLLNLVEGEVHLLRNAGGIVTEDVIRSLVISQRKLQTREVIVIQHTDCGMTKFTGDELRSELEKETQSEVDMKFGTFTDLEVSVHDSVAKISSHPFIKCDEIRGYIFDVVSNQLTEVAVDTP